MISLLLAGSLVIAPGASFSGGIGESRINASGLVRAEVGPLEGAVSWDSADKLESGRGWILHGDVMARHRGLLLGGTYVYRDGGPWVKRGVVANVGLERAGWRVVYGHAIRTMNSERYLTFTLRGEGRWVLEPGVRLISYLQSGERRMGVVTTVSIGRRW